MLGKKTGGRQRGTTNKITGAQSDLLLAWDRASGPETALELMKAAIKAGKEGNFDPLAKILPYIARKMPEAVEITDMNALEDLTDEELKAAIAEEKKNLGLPQDPPVAGGDTKAAA